MGWIKYDVNLHEKPKVDQLSALLSMDRFAVVGRLMRLWAWADSVTRDGRVTGVTCHALDARVAHPGFAEAMEKVGWLRVTCHGVEFPDFDRYHSDSEKQRLNQKRLARERQRRRRARDNCVTSRVTRARDVTRCHAPREEKIRIENSPQPPMGGLLLGERADGGDGEPQRVDGLGRALAALGIREPALGRLTLALRVAGAAPRDIEAVSVRVRAAGGAAGVLIGALEQLPGELERQREARRQQDLAAAARRSEQAAAAAELAADQAFCERLASMPAEERERLVGDVLACVAYVTENRDPLSNRVLRGLIRGHLEASASQTGARTRAESVPAAQDGTRPPAAPVIPRNAAASL